MPAPTTSITSYSFFLSLFAFAAARAPTAGEEDEGDDEDVRLEGDKNTITKTQTNLRSKIT